MDQRLTRGVRLSFRLSTAFYRRRQCAGHFAPGLLKAGIPRQVLDLVQVIPVVIQFSAAVAVPDVAVSLVLNRKTVLLAHVVTVTAPEDNDGVVLVRAPPSWPP